jgi:hypothetical protein
MRRRIYSEDLPLRDVADGPALGLLAERRIELVLAVRPWTLVDLPRVLAAAAERGVSTCVWPMISDTEGRWASAGTAPAFVRFAREVVDACERAGTPVRELLFDLEPPFDRVRKLIDHGLAGARRVKGDAAPLTHFASELEASGIHTAAAAIPLLLADGPRARYERWLGTPVHGAPYGSVQVMAYTSLVEGYSRGMLARDDARALLWTVARATKKRLGTRGGISLGAVAVGALGDERPYRNPSELADDVGIARAAGIEDLALFDLRGVLRRAPAEEWLDALMAPPTERPRPTRRARALTAITVAIAG